MNKVNRRFIPCLSMLMLLATAPVVNAETADQVPVQDQNNFSLFADPGTASAPLNQRDGPPDLPAVQNQNNVVFLSGGIGVEEAAAIKSVKRSYSLHVLFAGKQGGEYLAGTRLTIKTLKGDLVLDTVSRGPFLYANLRPGSYLLTASQDGDSQSRRIQLTSHEVDLGFYF